MKMNIETQVSNLIKKCNPLSLRPDITRIQLIQLLEEFSNLNINTTNQENKTLLQIIGNIPVFTNGECINVTLKMIISDLNPQTPPKLFINSESAKLLNIQKDLEINFPYFEEWKKNDKLLVYIFKQTINSLIKIKKKFTFAFAFFFF